MLRIALFVVSFVAFVGFQGETRAGYLGRAESFAVLAATTVTNTGNTTIVGDVGVAPGTSITGFGPGVVTSGTTHSNDTAATNAETDAHAAYNTLSAVGGAVDKSGIDLGGKTLTSGVYSFSSSVGLTGVLTLDAQGQIDPLFIFKIGSTITTASYSSVVMTNGGSFYNVFFLVGSSATLGTYSSFAGNIIAVASDTLTTGVSLNGRAFALNAAVTLDTNNITATHATVTPGPSPTAVPEPAPVVLLISGLASLFALRNRSKKTAA